jgi:hypothetical protein
MILATRPDYLLATKIEAFNGRGHEDFLGSRDFGDMISLIDGREELVVEAGGGEIRTPGTPIRRTTVFETAAFNRSATPPGRHP